MMSLLVHFSSLDIILFFDSLQAQKVYILIIIYDPSKCLPI